MPIRAGRQFSEGLRALDQTTLTANNLSVFF